MLTRRGLTLGIALIVIPLILNTSVLLDPALAQTTPLRIAVPLYCYPGPCWSQLTNSALTAGIVIANPSSGVGSTFDPNYAAAIQSAESRGILTLAYVYTNWGKRSLQSVQQEISLYYQWYKVSGVFVDEASTNCGLVSPYYQMIYNQVKKLGGVGSQVVLNPGTATSSCYLPVADIINLYEGQYSTFQAWQPPQWIWNYSAKHFMALVYNTSLSNLPNAVMVAKKRHIQWVYFTNLTLPNPWLALPPSNYWSVELDDVSH